MVWLIKFAFVNSYFLCISRYKNNHISPTEIESIVQEHPDVAESLVFGRKDPNVQELLSIAVVPKEDKQVMLIISTL